MEQVQKRPLTGGMSVRPEPFDIGPDGTQWEEGGIPSGFHRCPMKSRPVGSPPSYPDIIEPQQNTCPTSPANYKLINGVCVRTTGSAWDVRLCAGDQPIRLPTTKKVVKGVPTVMKGKPPTPAYVVGQSEYGDQPIRLPTMKKGVKGTLVMKGKPPTPGYVPGQPDYVTKGLSVLQSISSSLQGIATTLEPKPANVPVEPNTPTSVSAYGGRRIVSSKQNKKGKKTRRRN